MPSSTVRSAVWPAAEQAARVLGAVAGDPAVVGLEAGPLEVDVGVVADHHPDRRVDDLGRHAVADLVGDARRWRPSPERWISSNSTPDSVSSSAGLPAAATRPMAIGFFIPGTTNRSPRLSSRDHVRRLVAERRVDVGRVAVRRLGDVRVGADDRVLERHGDPLIVPPTVRRCAGPGRSEENGPMSTMPAAFIGHGSPMNALETNRYTEAWAAFGAACPGPGRSSPSRRTGSSTPRP